MTVNTVFGYNEVVPRSLDLIRDATPLPQWMNGISSYSLWWIIIHRDWYLYHGDLEYLQEQKEYLTGLLDLLVTKIDGNKEALDGHRFLDWPSSENPEAIHAGLPALMVMRSEEHTSELQSLMRISYAVFCLKKTTTYSAIYEYTNI